MPGNRPTASARAAAVLTLVLALVFGVCAPAVAAPTAGAVGGCPQYVAVLVPGTTETTPSADPKVPAGMLGEVGKILTDRYKQAIEVRYQPYVAEAFLQSGRSYAASAGQGEAATDATLARCPDSRYVIGGFSQGSQIATDVAAQIGHGNGPISADAVRSVVLMANPRRGTAGAQDVGGAAGGAGIAGPNPAGFGDLAGRVFDLCHPDDKYCSTDVAQNPFLAGLGRILGNAATSPAPAATIADASAQDPDGVNAARTELASDYGPANLAGATGVAARIVDKGATVAATDPTAPTSSSAAVDVAELGQQARWMDTTATAVDDTMQWLARNPAARDQLRTAPDGSPEASASKVVDTLAGIDLPAVADTARRVTTIADTTLTDPSATGDMSGLVGAAGNLAAAVEPLSGFDPGTLTSATSVLSQIKPLSLINQTLSTVAAVTSIDWQAVFTGAQQVPSTLLAGDIAAAHRAAGDLNNQLSPLVAAAAGVDLAQIARLVSVIPDPSGTASTVAAVLRVLAGVDIIGLAKAVGQAQEIAWQVLETGNVLAIGQLIPVGLDIATAAAGALLPGAGKSDPSTLQSGPSAMTTLMGAQAADSDLVGLGTSALNVAASPQFSDIAAMVSDGLTAASFLGSGVHSSYAQWQPTGDGRSAVQTMADIFSRSIGGF